MVQILSQYTMYSDTSKKECGASLWQMQGNQNKLVGYQDIAVSRYSISELELTGLASNISGFKHLLSKTEFTVYVDHSAFCQEASPNSEIEKTY